MTDIKKLDIVVDHILICRLLTLYGDLLTERSYDVAGLYFSEDWSISEIAEHLQISRQAVHDNLHRTMEQLAMYEQKLSLLTRGDNLIRAIEDIKSLLPANDSVLRSRLEEIETEYKVI